MSYSISSQISGVARLALSAVGSSWMSEVRPRSRLLVPMPHMIQEGKSTLS